MALRAKKDTFGIERVATVGKDGEEFYEIRRKIVAGQRVPDNLEPEDQDAVEAVEDGVPVGYRPEQVRGTEESDDLLRSGAFGRVENAVPSLTDEAGPRGRRRSPQTGASEAQDLYSQPRGRKVALDGKARGEKRQADQEDDDLNAKSRDDLNKIASDKGVEDPEKLSNKGEVIAAIRETDKEDDK